MVSSILHSLGGAQYCTLSGLRGINVFILSIIAYLRTDYLFFDVGSSQPGSRRGDFLPRSPVGSLHTAINICLFPPLLFFSGLYYTDVLSTALVLLQFLIRVNVKEMTTIRPILLILNGIAALSVRQTNIFWVALLPAMLDVIDLLAERVPSIRSKSSTLERRGATWQDSLTGSYLHLQPTGSETVKGSSSPLKPDHI